MPPLYPQLPTFCSFLYPPRRTQPWPLLPLLNLQWSQPRRWPTKSIQIQRRATSRSTQKRNDFGLLPGTFVMPSGRSKPSLFETPKLRMRLEWHRLKSKWRALTGSIVYKYLLKSRPRPKLQRLAILTEAKKLYKEMYSAFARGDMAALANVCHEGVLTSFRTRINVRPPKESLQWTLHKYGRSSRIVSTNIATLEIEKSAIYQVVVKLKSIQSLDKIPANGLTSNATEERKVVEYVVLQRIMLNGKEGKWKIWGTIEESKEDVLGVAATPAVG